MSHRDSDALQAARRRLQSLGLPLPPIPERFFPVLRQIEDWCFATADISPMRMYMLEQYVPQAVAGVAPDYLAFSHAGHGANSYMLNYYLVDGQLAVFMQFPCGGIYGDAAMDAHRIREGFVQCARLLAAADRAKALAILRRPGRLVVCQSEPRGIATWEWLQGPLPMTAAEAWLKSLPSALPRAPARAPALEAALWLDGLCSEGSPDNAS